MLTYNIDYTEGLYINNTWFDSSKIKSNQVECNIYAKFNKVKRKLTTYPNEYGSPFTEESIETFNDKYLITKFYAQHYNWYVPFFYKYFVPYHIEFVYENQVVYTNTLDCKFKLVNFNLNPKDDRELYVWLNVIEKFKKETQCDISIKNDIVFESSEFDSFVDVKFKSTDDFKSYYLGLNVGRFYTLQNSNNPDYNYHPDGLHNKNSLDIINDILYFQQNILFSHHE